MKKTIPAPARSAVTSSLVLVLALGVATEVAKADYTFGTPTNLGPPINSGSIEVWPNISADGLSLYFVSTRDGGGFYDRDLWVATRSSTSDDWGTAVNMGSTVNSPSARDEAPTISADGLELFFESRRPGGYGDVDLWVTTRATTNDEWGPPLNLGPPVNSSAGEGAPNLSIDGLSLYFASNRDGGSGSYDIWITKRSTLSDSWEQPVNLGPNVNSPSSDGATSISRDGLVLFVGSLRPGLPSSRNLYVSTRATIEDMWGAAVALESPINNSADNGYPSISADGSTLYFASARSGTSGGGDVWQAPIMPVVDLNGDGIVDCADMCIIVDHWGEYYPPCDIGPTPLGDGAVDVQDLIVLAEHLFEDYRILSHWKLDEAEGDIAYDSVGVYDGALNGVPTWQPTGGAVDGALEFDGIDDYVGTPVILDPAEGDFSVFVWIKGGAPGQVILSQESGVSWLAADAVDGALKTDLRTPAKLGRIPIPPGPPLISPTVVTDGDWHRVGFVRDGSDRILYVDDIEVARDTATNLESASGGLYIGAGSYLGPGAFWSGLIDDVRIYNRAVTP